MRTAYAKRLGAAAGDKIWREAVVKTGGRFYPAADRAMLSRAVEDITRLSEGTTAVTDYAMNEPQFAAFGLAAIAMWTAAVVLKLAVPQFSRFP